MKARYTVCYTLRHPDIHSEDAPDCTVSSSTYAVVFDNGQGDYILRYIPPIDLCVHQYLYSRIYIHACMCVHEFMIAQIRTGIHFDHSNVLYTGTKAQATTAITLPLLPRMRTMNTTSRSPLTCYMPSCCQNLSTRPLQNKSRPNLTFFSRTQYETHKQSGTSLLLKITRE